MAAQAPAEATPLLGGSAVHRSGPSGSGRHVNPLEVTTAVAVGARRMRRRTTLLGAQGRVNHAPMGLFGSFVFLSNLITGPGILGLPAAFRFGGFLLGGGLTLTFGVLSALSIAFIAHSCRTFRVVGLRATIPPGAYEHSLNRAPHIELETLVRGLGITSLWALFQLVFLCSMSLMAISCIVVTSAGLDSLSMLLLGNAWGFQVHPRLAWVASCPAGPASASCASQAAFHDVTSSGGLLISLGYLLTVAITLPMSLIDVSDTFQAASYCISLTFLVQLISKFFLMAYSPSSHVAGSGPEHPPVLGWNPGLALEVSFWSWCISFAGPMWVEEKDVSTPLVLPMFYAFGHRVILDLLLGWSGASAFPHMAPTTLNILQAVATHPACGTLTKASGIGFVVSSLASNIVDYAMVASRNLECHVGTTAANLLGIGVPFAVAWAFYGGASFANLVNAASPLLNGLVQFVVPALMFRAYTRLDTDVVPPSGGPSLRLMNMHAYERTWRWVALLIAIGIALLITLTYILNGLVDRGTIHPAPPSFGSADYAPAASR